MKLREIRAGLHWIQECGPDRHDLAGATPGLDDSWYPGTGALHLPQNVFLFTGDERTLLFDTLSPAARGWVVEAVDSALGGRPLDYVVVSHPDVPHAGNAHRLLRAHPEATLVAPAAGTGHALYHLEDALLVAPGDTLELGGFEMEVHEATFLDHSLHMWMAERTTRALLPVDWLGFPHTEHECLKLAGELDAEVSTARLVEFHGRVMFWFQYVDPEKVQRQIDAVWERFSPEILLPTHGLPVVGDTRPYFDRMKEVVAYVAEHGRTGVA